MNRIYIKNWLAFKPYNKQVETDSYYLNLCNKVKKKLLENEDYFPAIPLYEEDLDLLSCFLVSYLEDIVSESNLWNTFVRIHSKEYNKPLPFFDISDYYAGEVNVQDVAALIWYFFNSIQDDEFLNPFVKQLSILSSEVFTILDDAYEFAPENEHLKEFYTIGEDEKDYYLVRIIIDNILFHSYLFYVDTGKRLALSEKEIIEETDSPNINAMLQSNRDESLSSFKTSLLALHGKEWFSAMLPENHPLKKSILNISPRISGHFFYKGQDDNNIDLEHIASGKKFKLTKKSFDNSHFLKEIDSIVYMGIVNWMNEWWFSGVFYVIDFNPDLVLDEKNSIQARNQVAFLDFEKIKDDGTLQLQYQSFMEFNNDKPIAFVKVSEIQKFLNGYMDVYHDKLNLSAKEKEEARQRTRKDGFFGGEDESLDFPEEIENGVIFFNPKSGVEIALDINGAFPDKDNPFYNKSNSKDDVLHLFTSQQMSTELANYCVKNYKTKLDYLNTETGKNYINNLDFLMRFWKCESYEANPSITMIGKAD